MPQVSLETWESTNLRTPILIEIRRSLSQVSTSDSSESAAYKAKEIIGIVEPCSSRYISEALPATKSTTENDFTFEVQGRSPWQNGVAERFVSSCRRDLLDHVIVLNAGHLKKLMAEYVRYYRDDRTHLGLGRIDIYVM